MAKAMLSLLLQPFFVSLPLANEDVGKDKLYGSVNAVPKS